MVIFEPCVDEGYEWINAYHDQDYEVFRTFNGQPRASTWEPIKVRRVRADKNHDFKPSDFPWLSAYALIMRRRAVEALRDILEANGEILPLATDDGVELFVFNARVVDALNEKQSSIEYLPGTNEIVWFNKISFSTSKIQGLDLFRLPLRAGSTYVSERFVNRVKEAGLEGLVFDQVWP